MESILLFDKFLSATDPTPPSSSSPTEDMIFEDSFANGTKCHLKIDFLSTHDIMFLEIYMKFVDDSGDHIDLFSEIDRNHATEKMKIDEGKMCAKFIYLSRV